MSDLSNNIQFQIQLYLMIEIIKMDMTLILIGKISLYWICYIIVKYTKYIQSTPLKLGPRTEPSKYTVRTKIFRLIRTDKLSGTNVTSQLYRADCTYI